MDLSSTTWGTSPIRTWLPGGGKEIHERKVDGYFLLKGAKEMEQVNIFQGDYYEIENQINNFLDDENLLLEDIKYQVTIRDNYGRHEVTHYAMVIYKKIGW